MWFLLSSIFYIIYGIGMRNISMTSSQSSSIKKLHNEKFKENKYNLVYMKRLEKRRVRRLA